MKIKTKNIVKYIFFCFLLGAVCALVVWSFLRVLHYASGFLWETLRAYIPIRCYPLIVCSAGGLCIGLARKKFGDYPEDLSSVLGTLKREKAYPYKNMASILLLSFLPLLFGASVGPEAALVGIIAALCSWAGDNIRFARSSTRNYTKIGMEISLGLIFHSPLFGLFTVEEDRENAVSEADRKTTLAYYSIALLGGSVIITIMNHFLGPVSAGFPSFGMHELTAGDYALFFVYIFFGIMLAVVYTASERFFRSLSARLPDVLKETVAGVLLGLAGTCSLQLLFSGEEQMHFLMHNSAEYIPFMLLTLSIAKLLLTGLCISFGLKGGHFFPLIFAGVAMGYAVSIFFFANPSAHVFFCSAIIVSSLLGWNMKKPFAVSMLLMLCFPVKILVWIFLSAYLSSFLSKISEKKRINKL